MSYYAVRIGRTPGIYTTWDECKNQIFKFSGAVYKSFPTKEEAEDFMEAGREKELPEDYAIAYVDGSFNEAAGVYGCGVTVTYHGKTEEFTASGNNPLSASMRNVAGEILGAQKAAAYAAENGIKDLVIYYDYAGIEQWATGSWQRNKPETELYYLTMQYLMQKVNIYFVKVKGHTGVEGNERADQLAKQAVGIEE